MEKSQIFKNICFVCRLQIRSNYATDVSLIVTLVEQCLGWRLWNPPSSVALGGEHRCAVCAGQTQHTDSQGGEVKTGRRTGQGECISHSIILENQI